MSLLDELIDRIEGLPEKERAELEQIAEEGTKGLKWIPNPGPQTDAYFSEADVLLYGGQGGGGKTDLLLGLAMNSHRRSLIMRRQYTDLAAITERAKEIHGSAKGFSGSPPPKLRTDDGRLIDFGAAKDVGDEQHWQGQAHDLLCVGRGTPVLMGDGSWRAIEGLRAGDMVQTLEGPRRVVRAFPAQKKRAVEVRLPCGLSQIQSSNHELLANGEWVCPGSGDAIDRVLFSEPTQSRNSGKSRARFAPPPAGPSGNRRYSFGRPPRIAEWFRVRDWLESERWLGCSACRAQQDPGSDSVSTGDAFRNAPRSPLCFWFDRVWRRLLSGLAAWPRSIPGFAFACGEPDARSWSLLPGFQDRCSWGFRLCGGPPLESSGPHSGSAGGRSDPLQLSDAEPPSPSGCEAGGWARTPTHSDRTHTYAHPYTRGIRRTGRRLDRVSIDVSDVGVRELFDIEVEEVNHYITAGGFVNKNCFDEGVHFAESQIRFLMGWVRTADKKQRTRVVIATNPPLSEEGDWLIKMFAPWLDRTHPSPAKPGELRWFITDHDGNDREVEGPGGYLVEDSEGRPVLGEDGEQRVVQATSRTFIPSSVRDNPYLRDTGYEATLDALPEPLRSAIRDGNFTQARRDHELQLIPYEWVRAAQGRWKPDAPDNAPMCAIGADVASGGDDQTVLAARHDFWFDKLVCEPGAKTPLGTDVAALIIKHRRDGAVVGIDCGGGYGNAPAEHLEINGVEVHRHLGAGESTGRTKQGNLKFYNKRAEVYYRLYEALDPDQPGGSGIALPPDPELTSDLCAIRLESDDLKMIRLESKKNLVKRLGRSTDKGDAVAIAWSIGPKRESHHRIWQARLTPPKVNLGHTAARRRR